MAEPVSVEKDWDDLWSEAKGYSNSGIAGFLRNIFKYSLQISQDRVEHF